MLKFVRERDNVQVLQLIDQPGVFDVRLFTVVRKISNRNIIDIPFGLIKVFVYGICYDPKREFFLIFDSLIKNQVVECIFGHIPEDSPNPIHQAFAGDFFYEFKDKLNSFREVLIRENVGRPACLEEDLNQRLFQKRLERMAVRNSIHTGISIVTVSESEHDVLGGRFEIFELIGEGAV